jgi:hypothetical protein
MKSLPCRTFFSVVCLTVCTVFFTAQTDYDLRGRDLLSKNLPSSELISNVSFDFHFDARKSNEKELQIFSFKDRIGYASVCLVPVIYPHKYRSLNPSFVSCCLAYCNPNLLRAPPVFLIS